MRLDAMCCEVSLSRWIELQRLTVTVRYGWLRGTASCCHGGGLQPQCFVAAFCCLLHPSFSWYWLSLRHCWPLMCKSSWRLVSQRRMGVGFFPTQMIRYVRKSVHVKKWLGRRYRDVIKMHLFEKWGSVMGLRTARELCCMTGLWYVKQTLLWTVTVTLFAWMSELLRVLSVVVPRCVASCVVPTHSTISYFCISHFLWRFLP